MQPSLSPTPVSSSNDVALVGYRDADEAESHNSVMPADIGLSGTWDVKSVQSNPGDVGRQVAAYLTKPYWIHLDLDVLDEVVLPATDYLMPGGLTFAELSQLLPPLVSSQQFSGMSVACLNPEKDFQGESARAVADCLLDVLVSS